MTDGKKDQLKRKKTLEYELRRLYRAGELTEQQIAEAGKALSSGSLSAICDDYGMDYAVLNYGINDVGIQDLKESGFKTLYSDGLTVCLKRSTV